MNLSVTINQGMNEDLGLDETQYSVVLSIFFVTYILFGESRARRLCIRSC
jgi:hypothetical protein